MTKIGDLLEHYHWGTGIDLGCGTGSYAKTLKKHINHLIGVDKDEWKLEKALQRGYDEAVCCDIRNFIIPNNAEIVFLFDVIEHIPKQDGANLLNRITHPIILTTPSVYFPLAANGHACVWRVNELENIGFKCSYMDVGLRMILYGKKILAVRGLQID